MGNNTSAFPQVVEKQVYNLGGVQIDSLQILIFVVTLVLMFLLQFIVLKTKLGRAMRAVAVDKDAAVLMGVNVDNTITITFAIGSGSCGCSRRFNWFIPHSCCFLMGTAPGLKAFVAAV